MTKRIVLRIVLIVALAIVGFIYLLKSCLSKYDERSAIGGGSGTQSGSQFLVFEKEGKGVVFSLVKFDKTISYSQRGGSINKSVSTIYYAQTNDLETAAKKQTAKIKNHSQVKAYPVELMGAAANRAWLFAGELMAYDPFTLTKIADAEIIAQNNPFLKGKLINERKYYQLNDETGMMTITTNDGLKYELNTSSLKASPLDEGVSEEKTKEKNIGKLTTEMNRLRTARAKAYDRLRANNKLYSTGAMPMAQYKDSAAAIESEIKTLKEILDSLSNNQRNMREEIWQDDDKKRDLERLRRASSYSGMKLNADTVDGRWYGLYTVEKLEKLQTDFNYESVYEPEARNKFFVAEMVPAGNKWKIADEKEQLGEKVYLQGGFLVNRQTGMPARLGTDFLIVHKTSIGKGGQVLLTRITKENKPVWEINMGLEEFEEWVFTPTRLIIAGRDNKELSSGQVNVLLIIDLQTGKQAAYDYFTDKVRKP